MGGGEALGEGTSKSNRNIARSRKRVEVDASSLKRADDGSAFTRCEKCNRQVPVVLVAWHDCFIEAKIDKSLDAQMAGYEGSDATGSEKSKAKSAEPKPKRLRKEKKAKDPNTPKRPPTAFFLFMDEFRKLYKEANPDCKSVATVAKEGGEKWKSMTDEEKKPFMDKAVELKAEYTKALKPINDAENADDLPKEGSQQEDAKVEIILDG